MAKLEADGEFAEQLFTHGLGVQTAEGMAEWLHWQVRRDLGIAATQGRRYSWGYPACPSSPSTRRSTGCSRPRSGSACGCPAATPSSPSSRRWRSSPTTRRPSTSACATAACCADGSPDDVIKGSPRDPSRFGEIGDEDPAEPGTREPASSTA